MTHYRREIDGLRALAVLPVILFHAGFSAFAGGYVGVDVFFVISGYLITALLVAEHAAGTFSLVRFYERRARRILPALFLVMAVCIPCAWVWLLPSEIKDLSASASYVAVFASNVLFAGEAGYFDTAAELKPLLHTWSLAVEEQYYVIFPLLVGVLWSRGRRWLALVILVLGGLSLYASVTRVHEPAAVYLLTTRGWEIALGALVALITGNQVITAGRPVRELGSAAGVALVLLAVFTFSASTPFPGWAALLPTVGTAAILMCAGPDTVVGRVFSTRPLVGIGLISYSAYLWHQPVFAFARHARPEGLTSAALIGLSLVSLTAAGLSWRFVEQPFRRSGTIGRRQVVVFGLVGSLTFGLIGLAGTQTDGFVDAYVRYRLSAADAEFYRLIQQHTDVDPVRVMIDDGDCHFWSETVTPEFERRFAACRQRLGPAVLVLGDSHAMNLYNIIVRAGVRPFVAGVVQGGCRPHRHDPPCQYAGFQEFVVRQGGSLGTVIFHQSGSYLIEDPTGRVDSDAAFEPGVPFRLQRGNLDAIVAYLTALQQRVETIWLGPFAEGRVNFRDLHVLKEGPLMRADSLRQFDSLEHELQRRAAADRWTFRYVSLHDLLAFRRESMRVGSCLTFRNVDHFSVCGEELVAVPIRKAFEAGPFASVAAGQPARSH